MATIAELLIQSGLQSSQQAPDLVGGFTKGVELAQHAEQIAQQRQVLEQKKQEAQDQKLNQLTDDVQKASKLTGRALSGYKQFLLNKAKSYGMDNIFSAETLDLLTASPDNLGRFAKITGDVRAGTKTLEQAITEISDQSQFYSVTPDMTKDLGEAQKFALEQAASTERARIGAGQKSTQKSFDNTTELRKELSGHQTTKKTEEIQSSFDKIKAVGQKPSAAGDISLMTSYMKMLDPGSSVKEGEFANAQNAGGVEDRIRSQYNALINGERLSEKQRKDFITQAGNIYRSQFEQQSKLNKRYEDIAKRSGIDPSKVIPEFAAPDKKKYDLGTLKSFVNQAGPGRAERLKQAAAALGVSVEEAEKQLGGGK